MAKVVYDEEGNRLMTVKEAKDILRSFLIAIVENETEDQLAPNDEEIRAIERLVEY